MTVSLKLQGLLGNRPNLRAFAVNVSWLAVDKLTRLFVAVFISAWIARYLGPEQYGQLAYALTLVAMFQALSMLGLDNLVVRDIASASERAHLVLGTAVRLRCVGAAGAYITLGATVAVLHGNDPPMAGIILMAGLCILLQVTEVIDLWFQSQLQSRRTVVAKLLSYLTTAVLKVSLVMAGASLTWFAAVGAVEAALTAFSLIVSYRLFRTRMRWVWDPILARQLIKQSWPLLISGLSVFLYMRVSIIVLRERAGSAEVGLYSVGATLSEMWYFIPMIIFSSIAPIIARKRAEGADAYQRTMRQLFSAMWVISFAVAAFNIVGASTIVNLLYGHQYTKSAEVFAIHALTFPPVCIGVVQSVWLINEGRSKIALLQAIAGASIALMLNLLLTPNYGAHGAAIVTVVSQFVQAFLVNAFLAPDLFRLQCRSLLLFKAFRP
jgi:PST family polysaccharide transporter